MNIDPNYAICAYRDYPKQILNYIKKAIGIDSKIVINSDPAGNMRLEMFGGSGRSLLSLYYCKDHYLEEKRQAFYIWGCEDVESLHENYCVNFVPIGNIINRFLHVYQNYRRQQKADHQQDIKDAGLVYEVQ